MVRRHQLCRKWKNATTGWHLCPHCYTFTANHRYMLKKSNRKDNNRAVYSGVVTTIAAGTTVNGDVESESDMRIDGNVIGNIICKSKIVLGENAIVQGDIQSANADIFGTINGNAKVSDLLCLKSKSTINGNLTTGKLLIEPNAVFNGQCNMTSGMAPEYVTEKAMAMEQQN